MEDISSANPPTLDYASPKQQASIGAMTILWRVVVAMTCAGGALLIGVLLFSALTAAGEWPSDESRLYLFIGVPLLGAAVLRLLWNAVWSILSLFRSDRFLPKG